ncbi:hypothetical protein EJB05_08191, partial [Eragrostis curvula]
MLQASSAERGAGSRLWVPGMSPGLMDAGSARAQEIARRREEMLGMLHDLPESEYELSLTDLVEKAGADNAEAASTEGKEPGPAGRSASGKQAAQQVQQQQPTPGRPERRASARRRDGGSGGSSFRSSSDGVLLNFYMPRSLTRSFTAPRPSRTPSISGGRTPSVAASDCNKSTIESSCAYVEARALKADREGLRKERDEDAGAVKCWSLPWDRPWRKSSRRDPAAPPNDNDSTVRTAILKAAKHSAKGMHFIEKEMQKSNIELPFHCGTGLCMLQYLGPKFDVDPQRLEHIGAAAS